MTALLAASKLSLNRQFPCLTYAQRLASSADRFIGFNTCVINKDGNWLDAVRIRAELYRAGTEAGPNRLINREMMSPWGTDAVFEITLDSQEDLSTFELIKGDVSTKIRSVLARSLLRTYPLNATTPDYDKTISNLTDLVLTGSPTEFFHLFSVVEAKWGIRDDHPQYQMEDEMRKRLTGAGVSQQDGFRDYFRPGKPPRSVPLPVFVGNVLRHQGTNPHNEITPDDIQKANQFLREWANE